MTRPPPSLTKILEIKWSQSRLKLKKSRKRTEMSTNDVNICEASVSGMQS